MVEITQKGDAMKLKLVALGTLAIVIYVLAGCTTLSAARLTSTISPTMASTSTVLSTETPTMFESPMPAEIAENTPVSTLSSVDSENYVKELLENNRGCSLPCIWGIVPGQTSYSEAQQFFESLGWTGSESHGVYYTGKDLEVSSLVIDIGVYSTNSTVEKLQIGIGGKDFLDLVKCYSFGNILKTLGKPTEILVFLGTNPGVLEPDETSFEILLYYKPQNILIQYTGTAVRVGNSYHACLARPNAESSEVDPLSGNVSLYIGEADKISTPDEIVRPFWELPNYYLSSEKAFGMSSDKFYEMASQNARDFCFNSSLSVWRR